MSRFKLAICELHIPYLHGYTNNSDENIMNQYMITNVIELDEFHNNEYKEDIGILNECYLMWLYGDNYEIDNYDSDNNEETIQAYILRNNITRNIIKHPTIRNYDNIIDNGKYIKLDVVEIDELEGGEMVGYIKTFWLRIIQRKWKKMYKKRQEVIAKRKSLRSLKYREGNGKWSIKLSKL